MLDWLFKSKNSNIKQPRKVALINVHDYPREEYSAYWEIRVEGNDEYGYEYGVRIATYKPHEVVAELVGAEMTRDEADTAAQKWVKKKMKKFKRDQ